MFLMLGVLALILLVVIIVVVIVAAVSASASAAIADLSNAFAWAYSARFENHVEAAALSYLMQQPVFQFPGESL